MITTKKQAITALIKRCHAINKFCQEHEIKLNNSILSFYSINEVELSVVGGQSTDDTVCYFSINKDNILDVPLIIKYMKTSDSVNEKKFIEFINCLWGVIIEEDDNDTAYNIMLFMVK